MKILLVNPNICRPPVIPIGLLSIASFLQQDHHEISLLDLCLEDVKEFESIIHKRILESKPDIIGISIRNLDNGFGYNRIDYLSIYDSVVNHCQKYTKGKIVLGGPAFSILPTHFIMRYPKCIGIVGEGEEVFTTLISSIRENRPLTDVPNVISSHNGEIHFLKQNKYIDINSLPSPAFDLISLDSYLKNSDGGNIQTKRGCPFKCIFCSYPLIEGRKIRLKNLKKVVCELQDLKVKGFRYVHFVDSVFNYPEEHAIKICREIKRRGIDDIEWDAYFSPAFFSEELAQELKGAGCRGIIFGTDTASDTMLANLRKPFSKERIKKTTEICHKYGLDFAHHLLLGGPGETEETIYDTLYFMKKLNCKVLVDVGIQVYENTELANIIYIAKEKFRLLKPPIYIFPHIVDKLETIVKDFCEIEPNFRTYLHEHSIDPYTKPRVMEVYKQGFRGPYWTILDTLYNKVAKENILIG